MVSRIRNNLVEENIRRKLNFFSFNYPVQKFSNYFKKNFSLIIFIQLIFESFAFICTRSYKYLCSIISFKKQDFVGKSVEYANRIEVIIFEIFFRIFLLYIHSFSKNQKESIKFLKMWYIQIMNLNRSISPLLGKSLEIH